MLITTASMGDLTAELDASYAAQTVLTPAYAESSASAFVELGGVVATNDTTPVIVVPAPESARVIKSILAYNSHSAGVTLILKQGGTIWRKVPLQPGQTLDVTKADVPGYSIPLNGTAGQALVAGAGGVPAWSDTFASAKTIDLGNGALPAALTGAVLRLTSADAVLNRLEGLAWATLGLNLTGRVAGGTRVAPAATPASINMVQLSAVGYDTGYAATASGSYAIAAGSLWSATNRETVHIWTQTPAGSTVNAEAMRLQNGNLGIGVAPTVSNGLLQLATGTTMANGVMFGDTPLYRSAALTLKTDGDFALVGGKYIYLRGDAISDGSVRLSSQSSGTATIEKRASGTWSSMESWA